MTFSFFSDLLGKKLFRRVVLFLLGLTFTANNFFIPTLVMATSSPVEAYANAVYEVVLELPDVYKRLPNLEVKTTTPRNAIVRSKDRIFSPFMIEFLKDPNANPRGLLSALLNNVG